MTFAEFDADFVMREIEDPEIVCEIVGLLKADIPRHLSEYQAARAAGDVAAAQRAAHTIKGASANVAAREVCDLARTIEMSLKAGQTDVSTLEPPFVAACGRLTHELGLWEAALKASVPGAP
jgi:HPt (histidine-containing phosphotransfer) domain-containing protein